MKEHWRVQQIKQSEKGNDQLGKIFATYVMEKELIFLIYK